MIQVDLPVAFGSGTLLASALEHHTGERTWPYLYQRGLARNLIFQTLFARWLPAYLLVNYFGFQTSHMFWHAESLTDYRALLPRVPHSLFRGEHCRLPRSVGGSCSRDVPGWRDLYSLRLSPTLPCGWRSSPIGR